MPRKTFRRRPRAKKQARWRKRARMTTVVRSVGPIAPRTISKHKYVTELAAVSPGGGLPYQYQWNLNSTFDPDRSGTGHQPYLRDTYATLYNRYRVFACDYRVTFAAPTGIATTCGVFVSNNTTTYTNSALLNELPGSRFKMVQGAANVGVISGRCNLPKLMGMTSTDYKSSDNTEALVGASPGVFAILNVLLADGAGSTFQGATVRVELTYHTEWFDQIELGQS